MANSFLTIKEIARQALPRLMENLVFPGLIYRDFSDDFHYLGDTVRVRRPTVLQAEAFDAQEGVRWQDMEESAVDVRLDTIATVDVAAEAVETAVDIDDLNRVFVEPAAAALAEKINGDGLALYADVPGFTGAAGSTPSALTDLSAVRRALNVQKAPQGGRVAVWDPEADAAFATIPAIVNAEKSGTTQALREGAIGRVFGLENYMAQGVKKHKTGITAAQGVALKTAAEAGAEEIALAGTALSGRLVKGDLLTIGGAAYVVAEDSSAAAGNAISSVKIAPGLKEAQAAGAEVSLVGDHTANLAFHPMAFAFVTRPLINPDGEGVASYVTSYKGISLRVTRGYDQKYKRSTYSMDVLYGFRTVYPELAVRVLG